MSVQYQRISTASIADIIFYDPAAERRADSLDVKWDEYFQVASQDILYELEFSWYPKYVETAVGAWYYKNNSNGKLISAFDPTKLITSSQTLIQLDTFKAIELFYQSLVTDISNINEVDLANYKFSKKRYSDTWVKAVQLSNFYDLNLDGEITKLEENYLQDTAYMTGTRRFF
jgi:hypothetical protein